MARNTEIDFKLLVDKVHQALERGSELDAFNAHWFASKAFTSVFKVSRENDGLNRVNENEMRALIPLLATALPALKLTLALLEVREHSITARLRGHRVGIRAYFASALARLARR